MKSAKDIPPFVEHLRSIGRKNVQVGASGESAIPYEIWKVGVVEAGKAN